MSAGGDLSEILTVGSVNDYIYSHSALKLARSPIITKSYSQFSDVIISCHIQYFGIESSALLGVARPPMHYFLPFYSINAFHTKLQRILHVMLLCILGTWVIMSLQFSCKDHGNEV